MIATQYINKKSLLGMIPICDRSIYNMEKRGEFPSRIALSARSVVWDLNEVKQWIADKRKSGAKAMRPGKAVSAVAAC